jgi:hypothetical protein
MLRAPEVKPAEAIGVATDARDAILQIRNDQLEELR